MAALSDALVQQLLGGRYIASLATQSSGDTIHMVAVWYWFDGTNIYVATSSRSRKARNLQANSKVSLMIDSRDPSASFGITVTGMAKTLTGEPSKEKNLRIHSKYMSAAALADPRVGPVFAGWDDVTIQISPNAVISWDMRVADAHVFGGAFKSNPEYLLSVER
jgi:nitroimidazol reductase NimA-like FMN-containing flavoprotein (pyridoxamine 5'-phosphate oxidase superfamily)